jgi:hypothetical protein
VRSKMRSITSTAVYTALASKRRVELHYQAKTAAALKRLFRGESLIAAFISPRIIAAIVDTAHQRARPQQ